MSTMTTAVPLAPFMKAVSDALETMAGPEAVQRIATLHREELAALEHRVTAAQDEAARAVADSQRQHYLVAGLLETAQRETLRAAHQFAQSAQAGKLLMEIGRLTEELEDQEQWAAAVQRVLATPLPPTPWRAAILAFHPSQQYAAGHFADAEGAAHQTHPFAGWALVMEHRDHPAALVPVFLVDNELRTRSSLREERGVELLSLA